MVVSRSDRACVTELTHRGASSLLGAVSACNAMFRHEFAEPAAVLRYACRTPSRASSATRVGQSV